MAKYPHNEYYIIIKMMTLVSLLDIGRLLQYRKLKKTGYKTACLVLSNFC